MTENSSSTCQLANSWNSGERRKGGEIFCRDIIKTWLCTRSANCRLRGAAAVADAETIPYRPDPDNAGVGENDYNDYTPLDSLTKTTGNMATLRNHNAHRDIGFMTDRGETGKHIFSYQAVKGICPSPTGEVRWGLEVCALVISWQITQPMNTSPLSVSPVGEMLVSIVNEKPSTVK